MSVPIPAWRILGLLPCSFSELLVPQYLGPTAGGHLRPTGSGGQGTNYSVGWQGVREELWSQWLRQEAGGVFSVLWAPLVSVLCNVGIRLQDV